jgi:PD-(D/E)XK nuclease superfamily protein
MDHPKDVGDRTTLAVMLTLREAGFAVLTPFGENTRYDLAIDDGCRLARVQCKTGRLRKGAVLFAVCSCYGHHLRAKDTRRDYHGQVDYFGVYCPDNLAVYLVPIADLSVRVQAALRVEPARNNQRFNIRLASSYEIGKVNVEAPRKAPQVQLGRVDERFG